MLMLMREFMRISYSPFNTSASDKYRESFHRMLPFLPNIRTDMDFASALRDSTSTSAERIPSAPSVYSFLVKAVEIRTEAPSTEYPEGSVNFSFTVCFSIFCASTVIV